MGTVRRMKRIMHLQKRAVIVVLLGALGVTLSGCCYSSTCCGPPDIGGFLHNVNASREHAPHAPHAPQALQAPTVAAAAVAPMAH